MSALRMHHQHFNGVTVITLAGEIDLAGAPRLKHFIGEVRQTPADILVFDMAGVTFMDSSGLRQLLDAYTFAQRHGGAVHLAGLRGSPARLIEITRVGDRLRVHPSTDAALAAILATPGRPAATDDEPHTAAA
ncbi:STAS domain-containing protein [Nonomuraea jiangxiensis]|uniref:Anti-sigma factor antagonist n=1 Tax=Nonomuraea jiangxiensis TaxID=633440 RepID=A0A1G8Y229_9ACTN|nr:STAS domain-containing protein [Nonomuraea jiangxiensis]SDJ96841.1 anti-sigma B factor antagonist [Nonomuraea jiangxiensis]